MRELPSSERRQGHPASDIPWGKIVEQRTVPGVTWLAPQGQVVDALAYELSMKAKGEKPDPFALMSLTKGREMQLEVVMLENGLRYPLIRDKDTGRETSDITEYHGLECFCGQNHNQPIGQNAVVLANADLGEGYALESLAGGDRLQATIAKQVIVEDYDNYASGKHKFTSVIDPYRHYYSGHYEYRKKSSGVEIKMATPDNGYGPAATMWSSIEFFDCGPGRERPRDNRVLFYFAETGKLEEIKLFSRKLLDSPRAVLNITETMGIITLKEDDLQSPEAKYYVETYLRQDQLPLRIDRPGTLAALVKNIDSVAPSDPIDALQLVSAT